MAAILTSCLEGLEYVAVNGAPANVEFTLVEEPLAVDPDNPDPGELSAVSAFADLTEVTWTGYAKVAKALGAPVDGVWTIGTNVVFNTGAATNGPAAVRTVACLVPTTHEVLALWSAPYYLNGGDPINMSVANAVLTVTQPIELFLSTLTATV